MNTHGQLPKFAEGGPVGATSAPTNTETTEGAVKVKLADKDINRLKQLIAVALGTTIAGYVSERNQFDSELKSDSSKALDESKKISGLLLDNVDASQAVLDEMRAANEESKKVAKFPTDTKSLVLDTDKEYKKIKDNIDKMRKYYVDGAKQLRDEMSKIQDEMVKIEVAQRFKNEVEELNKAINNINIENKVRDIVEGVDKEVGTISKIFRYYFSDTTKFLFGETSSAKSLMAGIISPERINYGTQNREDLTPEQALARRNPIVSINKGLYGVLKDIPGKFKAR